MTQERVVTRVTTAEGTHINVRNDELEKYLADNPGAVADNGDEPAEEPSAEESAPRRGRRAATEEPAEGDAKAQE